MERILATARNRIPTSLADRIRPAYHYCLGVAAAVWYRFPAKQLTVIGITGTNGKSTVANLAAAVLAADGRSVALATTVNFKIGDKEWANTTKMTSPGRFATQRFLRQAVNAGCSHAVLEVSSHALYWHRTWGIPFQTAVFTNLSRDHLDLHKTMENYRNAKGRLFQQLAKDADIKTVAIANGDDPNAEYFLRFAADTKYVFGRQPEAADRSPLAHTVLAKKVTADATGSDFTAVAEDRNLPIRINIPGSFNISNALAAVAIGLAHDVDPSVISRAIAAVPGVAGRMQRVEAGQPFTVIVDYAHTPDAFDNVLRTLRGLTNGKLHVVFGATGDRDRGKRPDLGQVAATYADRLYLTEEDPGSEDPLAIISEIIPGIELAGKSRDDYQIIPKRREAIRAALAAAKPDDTVVLLAKGHETVMVTKRGKEPWDDRTVAATEMAKLTKKA